MSQRKKSQSKVQRLMHEDDDNDEDVTVSQITSTQAQRARENFTSDQIDRKVAEVVQFILVKDQKKIPVRRADIVKHVMKEYKPIYSEVINRVCRTFDQVYGFKLMEIDPKNHIYILINKLEFVPGMCPGKPKTGLLFVILSVIFMKGGVVKENLVWNTLKKLGVDAGEKHEEFGDVKKLVTEEFVRQKYLEYVKIPHTEPVEFEIRWGLRAEHETSKLKLLEFVAELHDQDPQSWSQQFKEANAAAESSQRS
ncbi:necdin-like 2 [Paramisgurnus dabryanus]|uniref:necdin-like 2 n=1 Tax=Paramisgurnus dabryanus TaxID=90735 RepID=UPI0031F3B129